MSNKVLDMNFIKKIIKKTKEEISKAKAEVITVIKKKEDK